MAVPSWCASPDATGIGIVHDGRVFPPGLYNGLPCNKDGVIFNRIVELPIIVGNVIEILLALIGVLSVIIIAYAGIQYIISQGDPGKVATAKSALTNAVVGVFLSSAAYLLVDFVARQFS